MSEYKVSFYFSTGRSIDVTTGCQPDDLTDFMNKMTNSNYQSFMSDNNNATIINMANVSYAIIEKIN